MFLLGGQSRTIEDGRRLAEQLIRSGQALEKFRRMVEAQGGDSTVIDDPRRLPRAQRSMELVSASGGYVGTIQCEMAGTACVVLGGGREKKEDSIDPSVGIVLHKKVSDRVSAGESLCTIHYNSETRAAQAKKLLERSYRIIDSPPEPRRLVREIIPAAGAA
jgi:pyrimidine-nucleoside phosphorylase